MKLEALLQDILEDTNIQKIIIKHRVAADIPRNGFRDADEIFEWSRGRSDLQLSKLFDDFLVEVKELVPYQAILSELSLESIFASIFYLLDPDIADLAKQHEYDKYGVHLSINGKKLEEGLYLQIPSFSTPADINGFIKENQSRIRALQDIYNKRKGFKALNIRWSRNFDRDQIIAALNSMSDQMIEEITGITRTQEYRDMYIAEIMRDFMAYEDVTDNIVEHVRKNWGKTELSRGK